VGYVVGGGGEEQDKGLARGRSLTCYSWTNIIRQIYLPLTQFTEKQKHITIRPCHLKECAADETVKLLPISNSYEVADIGNKALEMFYRLKQFFVGRIRSSEFILTWTMFIINSNMTAGMLVHVSRYSNAPCCADKDTPLSCLFPVATRHDRLSRSLENSP
jgi:hypothetical protein